MKKQDNTYLFILLGVVVVLIYLYFKDRKLNVTVETNTPNTPTTTGRTAAPNYQGKSTHSGNGIVTSFTFPHLLDSKPLFVQVTPTSQDAANYDHVESNDKTITVFYKVAPPEGVNNVSFEWFATL